MTGCPVAVRISLFEFTEAFTEALAAQGWTNGFKLFLIAEITCSMVDIVDQSVTQRHAIA